MSLLLQRYVGPHLVWMQQGGTSIAEKAKQAAEALKAEVKQAAESGKDTLKSTASTAKDAAEKGKEKVGEASRPMRISISAPSTPEHKVANPLALHRCWCHRRPARAKCAAL